MNVLQDLAHLLSIPRVESLIGALAKFNSVTHVDSRLNFHERTDS